MTTIINQKPLFEYLRNHFRLDWSGYHGAGHWARVLHNGLMLARLENSRLDVVRLFAFLHDHERIDEDEDYGHGVRAVLNAEKLRDVYFHIDDDGFDLLCQAMAGHSEGGTQADITVQVCWDADRLDLGRVGIVPHPKYLCTESAKRPDIIAEAYKRSITINRAGLVTSNLEFTNE